jgi:ferredoxin
MRHDMSSWDGDTTPEPVVIDCDGCAVRGLRCGECVVSVLVGAPEELLAEEQAALEVLAEAGLAPRLKLVPIHRGPQSGVA